MLLAEDLLILLGRKSASDPPARHETKPVLAAALLMELAAAGRLGVDWDGAGQLHVFVDDHTSLGDPELDGAIAIVAAMDGELLTDVVLALIPGLLGRLLNRLGLTARRRVAEHSRREYLRTWLAGVLYDLIPMGWGSGALITLLDLADATEEVTREPALVARANAIAAGDWPAGEAVEAIASQFESVLRHWRTLH